MLIRTITGAFVAILIYLWLFFSHLPVVLYAGMIILCVGFVRGLPHLPNGQAAYDLYIFHRIGSLTYHSVPELRIHIDARFTNRDSCVCGNDAIYG